MKEYNSIYLGFCVNNSDPEQRGRVQVFVPHIMPTMYEHWNKDGNDISFDSMGQNMTTALSQEQLDKLREILPWAEAASPIMGTSSPGFATDSYIPDYDNVKDQKNPPKNYKNFDQSPVVKLTNDEKEPDRPVLAAVQGDVVERTSVSGEQAAANPHDSSAGNIVFETGEFGNASAASPSVSNKQSDSSDKFTALVRNPNPHGPLSIQPLNNVAKGVFSYPATGAVLWVFFREGNPLFPVYFAASYGSNEWQSAYNTFGNSGPSYLPESDGYKNSRNSMGGLMNLGGVGGVRWENANNIYDKTDDNRSITFFGEDGSNIHFGKGYSQFFSKFDRRDQVEGDLWATTLGFKEEWVQGDSNSVTMGDVYVKVGNVSQNAVDAVTKIQDKIKSIQQQLVNV